MGPVKLFVGEVASFSGRKVKPLNLPNKPLPTSFESLGDFKSAEFISSVLLGVDLGSPLALGTGGGPRGGVCLLPVAVLMLKIAKKHKIY